MTKNAIFFNPRFNNLLVSIIKQQHILSNLVENSVIYDLYCIAYIHKKQEQNVQPRKGAPDSSIRFLLSRRSSGASGATYLNGQQPRMQAPASSLDNEASAFHAGWFVVCACLNLHMEGMEDIPVHEITAADTSKCNTSNLGL
jgi:hypothetical protein